jgi:hypothetical protein
MSFALRMRIGAVLALVVGGLACAIALALLGASGMQLPRGLAGVVSAVGAAAIVVRILVAARLTLDVVRAREDT